MNNGKRIIDASRGWVPPTTTQQQVRNIQEVKQQVRVMQQQPSYTVHVDPNANLMYQQPQQRAQPVMQTPPVKQVPQTVVKSQPVETSKKESTLSFDPTMQNFNLDGCKTIDQAYKKNENLIKINLE